MSTSTATSHRIMMSSSNTSSSSMSTSNRISVRTSTCAGISVLPTSFNTSTPNSANYTHHFRNHSRELREKLKTEDFLKDIRDEEERNVELMSDSQRSLSEGRLIDSDLNRDGLSQSHDSVFSESATASSLSIVLKAELADVLRKRRNRPDASGSEEDLGLPRSPSTPQRIVSVGHNANQSEVSSLSLLSMASSDMDDDFTGQNTTTITVNTNTTADYLTYAERAERTVSSGSSRSSTDDIDLSTTASFPAGNRLSHSAARHKMAVRPKKKGPTRHRRPTMEASVLPSTPELNEETSRFSSKMEIRDYSADKVKSRSLPPGVNAKMLEQHSTSAVSIKRSKTEKGPSQTTRNITKSFIVEKEHISSLERKEEESGFFRKYLLRNSKRGAKSTNSDECDNKEEKATTPDSELKTTEAEYKQKVEETRKEIRREIMSEAKSGLSGMLGSFILSQSEDKKLVSSQTAQAKPKSGPAARQRFLPKDLSEENSNLEVVRKEGIKSKTRSISESSDSGEGTPKKIALDKTIKNMSKSYNEEVFQSTSLVKEISRKEHAFEKRVSHQPRIVGLNSFQQKIYKSTDSMNSSDNDVFEDSKSTRSPRKTVEKAKSFRCYSEKSADLIVEKDNGLKTNVPSLPDLTNGKKTKDKTNMTLGFEINDNNLVKQKPNSLPLSQGIYTKNIILTTSQSSSNQKYQSKQILSPISPISQIDINEIEDSIDKIVKSPYITVIRNSNDSVENMLLSSSNIAGSPLKARVENFEKNFIAENSKVSMRQKSSVVNVERKSYMEPSSYLDRKSYLDSNCNEAVENKTSPTDYKKTGNMERKTFVDSKFSENVNRKSYVEYMESKASSCLNMEKSHSVTVPKIEKPSESKSVKPETVIVEKPQRTSISKMEKTVEPKTKSAPIEKPARTSLSKMNNKTDQPSVLGSYKETKRIEKPQRTSISGIQTNKNVKEAKIIRSTSVEKPQRAAISKVQSPTEEPKPEEPAVLEEKRVSSTISKITANFGRKSFTETPKPKEVASLDRKSSMEMSRSTDSLNGNTVDISNGLKAKSNSFNRPKRSSSIEESGVPEFMKIQLNRVVDPMRPASTNVVLSRNNSKLDAEAKSFSNESVEITDEKDTDIEMRSPVRSSKVESFQRKCASTSSTDDENSGGVILRKKSFGLVQSNDTTPELMKVFARRSLKIKDEDVQNLGDMEKSSSLSKSTPNVDSDKENQSASEEKLDKLNKIDQSMFSQKLDNRTSLSKLNSNGNIITNNNNNNNNNNDSPTKALVSTTFRHSTTAVNGFRNTNSLFTKSSLISENTTTLPTSTNIANERNINNNVVKNTVRHSTAFSPPPSPTEALPNDATPAEKITNEFKGIHQRRAEWEKRAKEALK